LRKEWVEPRPETRGDGRRDDFCRAFGRPGIRLLFILCAFFPAAAAFGASLRSASEIDYPPFCMVDESGRPEGFSVELLQAAVRAMGREVVFQTGTWAEVKALLAQGEVQALPLVGRTPEREEVFDFTFPYLSLHGAIVLRDDTEEIRELSDLRGRSVAVMRGDNAEEFLRRIGLEAEIRTTATFDQALRELSEGRHDAVVIQRLLALRLIRQAGLDNLRVVDRPLTEFRQDFCFAVREGDAETLAMLNEGLALAMADGTFRQLHAKWFAALELSFHDRIVVGGVSDFPPYEFRDALGQPAGFLVDLSRAVFREMGMDVEIRLGTRADILAGLQAGEIDVVQGLSYTPARDLTLDFTPPHTVIRPVAVIRRGKGPPPETVDGLRGKRLGVVRGEALHDFALENGLEENLVSGDSLEAVLEALRAGELDCALVPRLPALYFIRERGWKRLVVGRRPFSEFENGYAVRQHRSALLARLSEALKALDENGEFHRIQEKWLGVYPEMGLAPSRFLGYAAWIAGGLFLAALALLLRLQSGRKTERREARAALVASDARFKAIYDAMPLYLAIWQRLGNDFILADVNPATETFSRKKVRELLGTPLRDFYADTPWIISAIQRACREETVIRWESDYRLRSTNQVRHLNFRFVPVPPDTVMAVAEDVTDRKEAEAALAESLKDLRLAQRIARIGNWTFDPEEGRPVWSDEVYRIYHRDPSLGPPEVPEYRKILGGEHWETFSRAFGAAVSDGTPYNIELQVNLPDGEAVWVNALCEPDPEPGPAGYRLRGTIQDITERKRTEEALRESEARFAEATEAGRISVWVWEMDRNYIRHDPLYWRDLGYDPETANASPDLWKRVIHPGDIDAIRAASRACAEGNRTVYEMTHRVLTRAGEVRWVYARGKVQSETKRLVGTVQDITDRKMAEAALAESEEKYRRLTEMAPIGTAVLVEKRIVFANQETARIFGESSPEAMLGRTPAELVAPEDRADAEEKMSILFEGREAVPWVERRVPHPEGGFLDAEICAVPILYEGKPAVQACLRDVSERKRLEAGRRELELRMESARRHESLATMAGAIAHNFNNILMTVLGNLDMALEDLPEFDPNRPLVAEAQRSAQRAARLSQLMRLYVGQGQAVHQVFCLRALVRAYWTRLRARAPDSVAMAPPPPGEAAECPIRGDEAHVFQALTNLVENAVEAIGGRPGEIAIEVERRELAEADLAADYGFDSPAPGTFVCLTVADDGEGMGEEGRRRLFEPFYSTRFTGRGLGLAAVLGIVRGHGGAVRVASRRGAGTRVTLCFPMAEAELTALPDGRGEAEPGSD
jgi:two-component system sensor histidine kinase EvgS